MATPASPTPTQGASTSDILTAIKNIVTAINAQTQSYLNIQGILTAPNLSAATVVKTSAGRIATVSVIVAGTTLGYAYDSTSATAPTKKLVVIPNSVGVFTVNLATSFGLTIVPGSGQTVTVGYS